MVRGDARVQAMRPAHIDASRLALVHLVRKANDVGVFRAFLESYRAVPAGVPHELVLLLKGFESLEEARTYVGRDLSDAVILVPDTGFDLGAYFTCAAQLDHDSICYVNSFTTVRVPGWLGALHAALRKPGVGLAGATGSFASHWSWARYELGIRNAYDAVFPDRAAAQQQMDRLASALGRRLSSRNPLRRRIGALRRSRVFARGYSEFPAHHVRTNGFIIKTRLMREIAPTQVRRKTDAYRLEGGPASITRQVEAQGLAAVLVGADGHVFYRDEWPASATFWQGEQEQRMLDDNQTRAYERGDLLLRTFLARFAWGPAAAPSPPALAAYTDPGTAS